MFYKKTNTPKHSCFVKTDDILGLFSLKRDHRVVLPHPGPWSTQGRGKLSRTPAAELLFNPTAKLSNWNLTGSVGIQGAARLKPWKNTCECPWCLPPSYPLTHLFNNHSAVVASKRESKEWMQQSIHFTKTSRFALKVHMLVVSQ